jgi:hypothetical protein
MQAFEIVKLFLKHPVLLNAANGLIPEIYLSNVVILVVVVKLVVVAAIAKRVVVVVVVAIAKRVVVVVVVVVGNNETSNEIVSLIFHILGASL